MTSHLSIYAEAMSSGAALLRRPLRPALERRDRRQRPVVRRVRRKCVTRDGPLGGALLPPARGSVTLGRSATQDILGREPDAGVLPSASRPTDLPRLAKPARQTNTRGSQPRTSPVANGST